MFVACGFWYTLLPWFFRETSPQLTMGVVERINILPRLWSVHPTTFFFCSFIFCPSPSKLNPFILAIKDLDSNAVYFLLIYTLYKKLMM